MLDLQWNDECYNKVKAEGNNNRQAIIILVQAIESYRARRKHAHLINPTTIEFIEDDTIYTCEFIVENDEKMILTHFSLNKL